MTPERDDEVSRALMLATSDAEIERREGEAWLLAHPDRARPALVDMVRAGTDRSPEPCLRLLAAIDGEGALDAIEAALERGNDAESFYAAVALAEAGAAGRAVLERHTNDDSPTIRNAVDHALSLGS
jgi:hypothetical protein